MTQEVLNINGENQIKKVAGKSVDSQGNLPLTLDDLPLTTPTLVTLNFANDGAAQTGGVPVGGLYHTAGAIKIRLT